MEEAPHQPHLAKLGGGAGARWPQYQNLSGGVLSQDHESVTSLVSNTTQ